jgi:hypothetical protein
MKRIQIISLLAALMLMHFSSKAQLFVGGSYVYTQISESGLDDVTGISFDLQGEFKLPKEKLSFIPTIRYAILDSKIYSQSNPFYIKNFSVGALVSYKLIEFKGFSLNPYAGPFINKIQGRRAPSLFFQSAFIDDTRYGVEFGLEFKLKVYDFFIIKINPINLQIGNEMYRQGNVNVMFSF